MIVVDSSVWIAHLRDVDVEPARKLQSIERSGRILVGDIILLEVLQGARNEHQADDIERMLRQFPIERMLDEDLAIIAARNYRFLRSKGVTIRKTIDVVIASFCLVGDHLLLHADRDFNDFARHLDLRFF